MVEDGDDQQSEERDPADLLLVERRARFPARNPFTLNSNRKMYADSNLTNKWSKDSLQFGQQSSNTELFPLHFGNFDQEAYLSSQRMNEKDGVDQMKRFQFNQFASDHTNMDRHLKDFRHSK